MPEYEIRVWVDVLAARRELKALASEVGFPSREATELAIVASELGSNILKYGQHGRLTFGRLESSEVAAEGISLVARDYGPQFHDLATALQDGCDDRGPLDPMQLFHRKGIGGGLGAVLRMTHSFAVHPLPDGKEIVVCRYLKARASRLSRRPR
jgi:anti-sigma regulatory factor (Ser/Thr protein kinase)